MTTAFSENKPKYGVRCKICSLKYSVNYYYYVGEREEPLLPHLFYSGSFVHYANFLGKYPLGVNFTNILVSNFSAFNDHNSKWKYAQMCWIQKLQPKICCKISAEMLVKQNSIICAIYFMPTPLRIAKIGWWNWLQELSPPVFFLVAKTELFYHIYFLLLLMTTSFSENVLKYGAGCKSCSLKYVIKY